MTSLKHVHSQIWKFQLHHEILFNLYKKKIENFERCDIIRWDVFIFTVTN